MVCSSRCGKGIPCCDGKQKTDGSSIQTLLGTALDADGDGQPGGLLSVNFSTVSVAPLANTYLASRIVDPGPDLVPRTKDDVGPGVNG